MTKGFLQRSVAMASICLGVSFLFLVLMRLSQALFTGNPPLPFSATDRAWLLVALSVFAFALVVGVALIERGLNNFCPALRRWLFWVGVLLAFVWCAVYGSAWIVSGLWSGVLDATIGVFAAGTSPLIFCAGLVSTAKFRLLWAAFLVPAIVFMLGVAALLGALPMICDSSGCAA